MFFFIFHNSWKEERNGFKAYPDFGRGGGKDKFNVNNTHICEFRFDSGDINISIGQGKKKRSDAMWFKHSKTWKSLLLKANLQLALKLMIFNFLTPVLFVRTSNFMMFKIKSLKVILKMLNLEKRQSSQQYTSFLCS